MSLVQGFFMLDLVDENFLTLGCAWVECGGSAVGCRRVWPCLEVAQVLQACMCGYAKEEMYICGSMCVASLEPCQDVCHIQVSLQGCQS